MTHKAPLKQNHVVSDAVYKTPLFTHHMMLHTTHQRMNTILIVLYHNLTSTMSLLTFYLHMSNLIIWLYLLFRHYSQHRKYLPGGGGGDPGEAGRQVRQLDSFFFNRARTLDRLWLLIPSLYPYSSVSDDNRDGWTLLSYILKKLTDNGKIGVESIFILQKIHNENQPGYWKGQICVSHISLSKKNTGGSEQWASVSCIHRQFVETWSFWALTTSPP